MASRAARKNTSKRVGKPAAQTAPRTQHAAAAAAAPAPPTEQQIRARAYQIFEERTLSRVHATPIDDWLRAERELAAR